VTGAGPGQPRRRWTWRGRGLLAAGLAVTAAVVTAAGVHGAGLAARVVPRASTEKAASAGPATVPLAPPPGPPARGTLPATPDSYLGIYVPGAPGTYAGLSAFTAATGISPALDVYYSGWYQPFSASFAVAAARHGAVTIVQINPGRISLAAIAAGQYDQFLDQYALAVRAYGKPVVLSFGHEMNGYWYGWGSGRQSPAAFVAAWRHIVDVFRHFGADNVTWLWTVNVANPAQGVPYPAPWWPGRAYVNWVGVDGYFYGPGQTFGSVFAATIRSVRALSGDPVLVAETSVVGTSAAQAAKIPNLFRGMQRFGVIGMVFFDALGTLDWRLHPGPATDALALAARQADLVAPRPGLALTPPRARVPGSP
jgi:mannan endo-1,4-beta-mannosidase